MEHEARGYAGRAGYAGGVQYAGLQVHGAGVGQKSLPASGLWATIGSMQANRSLTPFLYVSLFALALAASTGVLLRFGMIYGMPAWALNFAAVRHAHSHLMYFGWVTLALMVFIWRALPGYTGRPLSRAVTWQLAATSVFALLSYPAFWQNGYGLTQIGSAHLPLGSMVSTFNGLTWFWFVFLYVRATRGLNPRPLPVQLWDWAIMLLLLASLGAAGLVGLVFSRVDNPFLQQLFLHQFLDLFAVGWFNLAVLGVFWWQLGRAMRTHCPAAAGCPTMSLALLLAPTFRARHHPGAAAATPFLDGCAGQCGRCRPPGHPCRALSAAHRLARLRCPAFTCWLLGRWRVSLPSPFSSSSLASGRTAPPARCGSSTCTICCWAG